MRMPDIKVLMMGDQGKMEERFLTLMAIPDGETQRKLAEWYNRLKDAGFSGTQPAGVPYHITLASFSPEKEAEVKAEMERLSGMFAAIPVHISHIGIFEDGKVLFGAPDMNPSGLLTLREAIRTETVDRRPWTPHVTLLMDEAETVREALPVLLKVFRPFCGEIRRLHLYDSGSSTEIAAVSLKNG